MIGVGALVVCAGSIRARPPSVMARSVAQRRVSNHGLRATSGATAYSARPSRRPPSAGSSGWRGICGWRQPFVVGVSDRLVSNLWPTSMLGGLRRI